MSNIEEDIKVLTNIEKLIRIEFKHYLTDREMKAINNVLLEREQDKKRIQELEEKNKLLLNSKVGIDLSYDDYISKQKIKDKIEDLRYNNKLGFEESLEEFFKIEVLEELLEEE